MSPKKVLIKHFCTVVTKTAWTSGKSLRVRYERVINFSFYLNDFLGKYYTTITRQVIVKGYVVTKND